MRKITLIIFLILAVFAALIIPIVSTAQLTQFQKKLISGTNIKTINGTTLLGAGNLVISGGGGGDYVDKSSDETIGGNKKFSNGISVGTGVASYASILTGILNVSAFSSIGLQNLSTSNFAAAGCIFKNDVGSYGQLSMGSVAHSSIPSTFAIRTTGTNGLRFEHSIAGSKVRWFNSSLFAAVDYMAWDASNFRYDGTMSVNNFNITDTATITTMSDTDNSDRAASTAFVKRNKSRKSIEIGASDYDFSENPAVTDLIGVVNATVDGYFIHLPRASDYIDREITVINSSSDVVYISVFGGGMIDGGDIIGNYNTITSYPLDKNQSITVHSNGTGKWLISAH